MKDWIYFTYIYGLRYDHLINFRVVMDMRVRGGWMVIPFGFLPDRDDIFFSLQEFIDRQQDGTVD